MSGKMFQRFAPAALALTLAVVLLCGCGGFQGDGGGAQAGAGPQADGKLTGDQEAVVALSVDVDRFLKEVEKRDPQQLEKRDNAMVLSIVRTLGLTRLQILLLLPEQGEPGYALVADDPDGKVWQQLSSDEQMGTFFEPTDDGGLRPKSQLLEMAQVDPSQKKVQLRSISGAVVAALPEVIARIDEGSLNASNQLASKLAAKAATGEELASLGIVLPEKLPARVEKLLSESGILEEATFAQMLAEPVNQLLAEIERWTESTEGLALAFRFEGEQGRCLSYVHQFRTAERGENARKTLGAQQPPPDLEGLAANLVRVLQADAWKKDIGGQGALVTLDLRWIAEQDFEVAMGVQSIVGSLMGSGPGFKPSEGPIETAYAPAPQFDGNLDAAGLNKQLAEQLESGLFVRGVFGTELHLELDPVPVPNAELLGFNDRSVSVVPTSVKLAGGGEALDAGSAEPEKFRYQDGHIPTYFLQVPLAEGTEPEKLDSATLQFDLPVVAGAKIFKFQASDAGKSVDQDGATIELETVERDVAQGKFRGLPVGSDEDRQLAFAAKNATGQWIRQGALTSQRGSSGTFSVQFQGEIAELWVVAAGRKEKLKVEVSVPLNGGQEVTMPEAPSGEVPSRYELVYIQDYRTIADQELQGQVEFDRSSPMLKLELPQGNSGLRCGWEAYWFAGQQELIVPGHDFTQQGMSFWRPRDESTLADAGAVVGLVRVTVPTDVANLVFEKQADGQWLSQDVEHADQPVRLRFDHQIVSFDAGDAEVLQMRATDGSGRWLKADMQSQSPEGALQQYYWGPPNRVEIVLSYRELDKRFPFEIVFGDVDSKALAEFQAKLADRRAVVAALKQISQADEPYESVAGLHYLYNFAGEPEPQIPAEVALACPDAAELYGYEVKPFHGYYFGFTKAYQQGGQTRQFQREPYQAKWKGGDIEVSIFRGQRPMVVAWPVDQSQPTFVSSPFGDVRLQSLGGKRVEVAPDLSEFQDWVRVSSVEGEF